MNRTLLEPFWTSSKQGTGRRILPLRAAILTHAISPHRLALLECVGEHLQELQVFVSEAEDRLHKFPLDAGRLNVTVQRSLNWEHRFRNVHGYPDVSHVHVPYDTYRQLSRYRPDVIVSTELGVRTLLAALYRRRHRGTRLVLWATLSERTEETRGWLRALVRGWLLRQVDEVFVNGRGGESYLRHLGYTGALTFVPYAIDGAAFQTMSYQPTAGRYRLLYTGQLIPRKGLPTFCRVLDRWCHEHPATEIQLTLVGEGNERAALECMRTAPSLRINVLDRVSQEQLAGFYEDSDIFAFPTLGDEWGVVVNEALIAGRPVLGSVYSQAVTELVEEGSTGWLWNPDEEASLYAALSRAFSTSVEDLKTMSCAAQAMAGRVRPDVVSRSIVRSFQRMFPAGRMDNHAG